MARNRKNKKKNKKNKRRKPVYDGEFVPGVGYVGQPTGCHQVTNPKDDEWETDLEVITQCGRFKADDNGKVVVWVEPLAKVKIDTLMEEYKSKEWLGYLLGDKESMTVKDIFIPEQNATSVRVDDVNCEEFNNMPVMGVIHSHHNMGTNFSHTDHTYINQNHDISLLVAHSGMSGQVRTKVPCGAYIVSEVKVKLALTIEWDKDEWLKDAKEKIKSPVYTYQQQNFGRSVQPGKPQFDGTGYWFNGRWHASYPRETVKKEEPKAQSTVRSWICTSCDGRNWNMSATICAHCRGKRFASKAEENQFKIEKEWQEWEQDNNDKKTEKKTDDNEWSSGIPEKNLGSYSCGRCNKTWSNVDLTKFTKCPECDKVRPEKKEGITLQTESYKCKKCKVTWELPVGEHLECPRCDAEVDDLVEELKKDLENAEATAADFYCKSCSQPHWTQQEAIDCCPSNSEYKCTVCGELTNFPNTTHVKCLGRKVVINEPIC